MKDICYSRFVMRYHITHARMVIIKLYNKCWEDVGNWNLLNTAGRNVK